jgi:hypothetical protein
MGQDLPEDLFCLAAVAGRPQLGAQFPFHLRNRALDVPAMTVQPTRKAAFHLPAIPAPGPATPAARVERDDGRANAEILAGQAMMVFGVVGGVGQQPVDEHVRAGLSDGRCELGRVLARTGADHGPGQQVAGGLTDQREFGPAALGPMRIPASPLVVARGVSCLQSGGVDNRFDGLVDQAACPRSIENGGDEVEKAPFFSSRSWAYLSVE